LNADTPAVDGGRGGSLRGRLLGAGVWTVVGTLGAHLMRLGGNLIVTRFLLPEMYGVMAIVITLTTILHLLSDIGLHQMVVRHERGHERGFLDTVWTVQVLRGGTLAAITVVMALGLYVAGQQGWLAADSAYASPELPAVLAASALGAVIHGFQSTKFDLAVRGLDLRRNVVIELVQQAFGLAVMIGMAWSTGSIWSLVLGSLAGTLLFVVLTHAAIPGAGNRFAWNREVLRQLAGFGKWLLLSSAIGVFAAHADRLLLAGLADARFLGLYAIALALAGALAMVFERLFGQVLMPALAEVARRDPAELPDAYWKARRRADPVILLASGALFALGPLVVGALYDTRYADAGPVLSVLALAMLFSRYQLLEQVYLVLDRPQYLAALNLVSLVATFVLVPLGFALGGPEGGVLAIACRGAAGLPLLVAFNARHGLNRFGREAALLLYWPLGWAGGALLARGAAAL
jgi:O-antigen/teichoic acid export membrane protein